MQTARNVAIIIALALVVYAAPGGREGASFLGQVLSAVFIVLIVLILGRLYRAYRSDIYALGDRYRLLLYGALGTLLVTLAASRRLFETGGPGVLLWFALVGGASYAVYAVWRQYRAYG